MPNKPVLAVKYDVLYSFVARIFGCNKEEMYFCLPYYLNDTHFQLKWIMLTLPIMSAPTISVLYPSLLTIAQTSSLLTINILCVLAYVFFKRKGSTSKEKTALQLALDKRALCDEETCITKSALISLEGNLEELVVKREWFLNPELNINMVSEKLGICTSYLSRYLNRHQKMSFTTYINQYRIEYALELMKRHMQGYTMEYIAQNAGFNNRTTFYRAFKKEKGMAPTQYLELIEENAKA